MQLVPTRLRPARLLSLILVTLAPFAPAAAAQEDPRTILEASTTAISEAEGFAAQFDVKGDGSAMVLSTMPKMDGRFVFGRVEETGPALRMFGTSKDTAESEPYQFDFRLDRSKLAWTDDEAQTVNITGARPTPRNAPSPVRLAYFSTLLEEQPLSSLLARATSMTLEDPQSIGGVDCHAIRLEIGKNTEDRNDALNTFNAVRVLIAKSDSLPRGIEAISDSTMINFSIRTELTGLVVGPQSPATLDNRRPENYTVTDRTAARKPRPIARPETPSTPATTTQPTRTEAPAALRNPSAPGFRFVDDGGTEFTNASQTGRVTVLYYWGTWCIPCRAVSPKMSAIAERYSDQPVDVLGLAIRERDQSVARGYLERNNYQHRLVFGAENSTRNFRVRVYPTVIVIGPTGEIEFSGSLSKERDPDALAEEVAEAVQTGLNKAG